MISSDSQSSGTLGAARGGGRDNKGVHNLIVNLILNKKGTGDKSCGDTLEGERSEESVRVLRRVIGIERGSVCSD